MDNYAVYKNGDYGVWHKPMNPKYKYGICMPSENPTAFCSILFETQEEANKEAAELNEKYLRCNYHLQLRKNTVN
jgi:hypothetical protein